MLLAGCGRRRKAAGSGAGFECQDTLGGASARTWGEVPCGTEAQFRATSEEVEGSPRLRTGAVFHAGAPSGGAPANRLGGLQGAGGAHWRRSLLPQACACGVAVFELGMGTGAPQRSRFCRSRSGCKVRRGNLEEFRRSVRATTVRRRRTSLGAVGRAGGITRGISRSWPTME